MQDINMFKTAQQQKVKLCETGSNNPVRCVCNTFNLDEFKDLIVIFRVIFSSFVTFCHLKFYNVCLYVK